MIWLYKGDKQCIDVDSFVIIDFRDKVICVILKSLDEVDFLFFLENRQDFEVGFRESWGQDVYVKRLGMLVGDVGWGYWLGMLDGDVG